MTNLENELHRLEKPEPREGFRIEAKNRLMQQIVFQGNESWFKSLLKKFGPIAPSRHFAQMARVRLLNQADVLGRPVTAWWVFAKRFAASTLVMTLAVTTTLFFVDGKQQVVASGNTYLEVITGAASLKRAAAIEWITITAQTQLSVGDLVRIEDDSTALVHFFDDSELRLAENSLILLSRVESSPAYSRQGIIEVSLHQGRAWVQTLNVDDGFAKFTVVTPNSILSTTNAAFDVFANPFESTHVRVFKHNVNVRALHPESREVYASGRLNNYQQMTLENNAFARATTTDLNSVVPILDLAENDLQAEWVINNLSLDRSHITEISERDLNNLRASTGTLPGQLLYPLKRAKEHLSMAFSFGEASETNTYVDMANQRINEAIVLIQSGDIEKAKLALVEYQNIVQQLIDGTFEVVDLTQVSTQILATHQKTLVAALPGDAQIGIVNKVLNRTEEMFAEDATKLIEVRLQNAVESMVQVQDLLIAENASGVKEALIDHDLLFVDLLGEVDQFDDEEKKALYNQILEAQNEQQRVLNEMVRGLSAEADTQLVALFSALDSSVKEEIEKTTALARPLSPDFVLSQVVVLTIDKKVNEFIEKVHIYSTYQGQKNQINRLLRKNPQHASDPEFLTKVRDLLNERASEVVNLKILELSRKEAVLKGKAVQRRIDAARRGRR